MFTGIVECIGEVVSIVKDGGNLDLTIQSPISGSLKIDQSVSHNGICLTVVGLSENTHTITAIAETLKKTNLDALEVGHYVNLERCMQADGRFDGHIVQGHVDTVVECLNMIEKDGSWEFEFSVDESNAHLLVDKGSVCINGTSLTCYDTSKNSFKVAIIPYTFENTVFKSLKEGDRINIEFDIIGKYLNKIVNMRR